jgi:hypothetical protein
MAVPEQCHPCGGIALLHHCFAKAPHAGAFVALAAGVTGKWPVRWCMLAGALSGFGSVRGSKEGATHEVCG